MTTVPNPAPAVPADRIASADPRDPAFFDNPYAFYSERHRAGPVFFWREYGMWCFAGFDDVNRLLRDRRFGRQILHVASRAELGLPEPRPHLADFDLTERYSLLSLEPPAHTRLRRLVNRAFVSRQVERLRPTIEDLANELIDAFAANGEVEIIEAFAMPLPVLVIADMLGVPRADAGRLLDWSHRMVRMYMFEPDLDTETDSNTAAAEFLAYLRDLVAERRADPRDDLLSHMITAEQDGQHLSEDELVSTAILLLNAGHEATVHTTGNAIKTILESSSDPADLLATPAQTAATVEEALRFDAPLHMFTRYALEDIDLGNGVRLKKGEEIGLLLGAANRDPSRFARAHEFDPFRADGDNVSFGAGIHFCIGAPLARIELQTALRTLFERLPGLSLKGTPHYRDVYHFHGLDGLRVSW